MVPIDGQGYAKDASAILSSGYGDCAFMRLYHPLNDSQTETRATRLARPAGINSIEAVEDARGVFRRNAWAFIMD